MTNPNPFVQLNHFTCDQARVATTRASSSIFYRRERTFSQAPSDINVVRARPRPRPPLRNLINPTHARARETERRIHAIATDQTIARRAAP